jgi:uncharacterized membrane protein
MAKVSKTATINAPVEKVFNYLNDPVNLPGIWPSMIEVKDIQPAAVGGYNFGWVYKMSGMRFEGATETVEHLPNQRIVTRSTKGIDAKFTFLFETGGEATKLSVEVEYKVPVPLLGKLAEALIVKQNERESEELLENLKAKMES